jgi:GMP synthase-like glutamine amidotransferase
LTQHGINFEVHNAGLGQTFPASIEPYAALAVMGGGMSANDDLLSNRQAEILILQAVLRDVPVIGHCLGGQLMSRALGATVGTSPRPEIGWQSIQYDTHAEVEKWFGSAPTPTVIQWHYDAFTVPRGATRLAGSSACPNQAWSMGPHLAMQFHIEMDAEKAQAWAADEDPKWAQARELYKSVQDSQATADHIYTTWLRPTEWVRAL